MKKEDMTEEDWNICAQECINECIEYGLIEVRGDRVYETKLGKSLHGNGCNT